MNRRRFGMPRRQAGFSLIEVMVAVLVLGIGLLGFALLQTMTLRFTQSANYRTQATNLAYDLLDQMRANRHLAAAARRRLTRSASARSAGSACTRSSASRASQASRCRCICSASPTLPITTCPPSR